MFSTTPNSDQHRISSGLTEHSIDFKYVLHCFLEEDKFQFTCTLQVVLIDLALEVINHFLQLLEILIAGLAGLETENLGEVTILHLLHLYSFSKSLAHCRAVAEKPLSISHIVKPVTEDSLNLM